MNSAPPSRRRPIEFSSPAKLLCARPAATSSMWVLGCDARRTCSSLPLPVLLAHGSTAAVCRGGVGTAHFDNSSQFGGLVLYTRATKERALLCGRLTMRSQGGMSRRPHAPAPTPLECTCQDLAMRFSRPPSPGHGQRGRAKPRERDFVTTTRVLSSQAPAQAGMMVAAVTLLPPPGDPC